MAEKFRCGGLAASVLAGLLLFVLLSLAAPGQALAQTYRVCAKQNSELDMNLAILANARAKLENPAYFGSSGSAAPESFVFSSLPTITAVNLASTGCDIFIGGGSPQMNATEGAEVFSWANAGNRFVIGGCDYPTNNTCLQFGRSLTSIANGGVSINSLLSYNPLTCGGALGVATFGGASTSIGTVPTDSVLATHNVGGSAAATTDSLTTPKFIFTADADMFGNSGSGAIGTGPTAVSDQAKFVVNVFKFAADALSGRLLNPQCFASYDATADLSIAAVTSNATPSVGGQTTLTLTVSNAGPNAATGVAARLPLPVGYGLAGQAGTGTYLSGTGVWSIGAIPAGGSAQIVLTLDVTVAGSATFEAEIISTSLADPDSSTNAGFTVDDRSDGIADDDETSLVITASLAPPGPIAGGGAQCEAGTDALFILDNSGSISPAEYAQMQTAITSVAAEFLSRNPNHRIAIAHYGGPTTTAATDGGQYVYIERNFSSAPVSAPIRQFGTGGAFNTSYIQDYMAGAIHHLRYALDGNALSTVPLIASPIKELDRATTNPLHVLVFTDAVRDAAVPCCSVMIDLAGSAEELGDGSNFTTYNSMKSQGATFSFVSFNAAVATAAAIASPGGTYTGSVEANPGDPEPSGDRRLIHVTSGFALTVQQVELAANNICPISTADLSLHKTVDDPTPATGGTVTYTLNVANAGPAAVGAVEVTDRLPSGLAYVSHAGAGTYDPATGLWTVGAVSAGGSASLQIVATVLPTGDLTNRAEITASDRSDPDSDPAFSFGDDDLGDTIADDDEAEVTVVRTDLVVEGRIFADNGAGGGTAHDAVVNGSETGLGGLQVEAFDGGGGLLGSATTAGDGSYRIVLAPAAVGSAVTLRTGLAAAHLRISERPGALPGLVNPSTTDGEITFTPAAVVTYAGIDFGEIAEPTLTVSRASSATAGSTLLLAHTYTASSAAAVTFSLADLTGAPPVAFSTTLFLDADCNGAVGAGEGPVAAPVAVAAGDVVCLLVRVVVAAGAPEGATLGYDVLAQTAFTSTAVTDEERNTDAVTVVERAEVEIAKRVRNVTQAGSFGSSNAARPGEVLEYSVVFTNPGKGPAFDVRVLDKTPVFTSLSAALPAITATPAGMTCTVVTPAGGGAAGYRGPLEWVCTGSMTPGTSGEVRFRVQLDP